jgi:hypothetical protein
VYVSLNLPVGGQKNESRYACIIISYLLKHVCVCVLYLVVPSVLMNQETRPDSPLPWRGILVHGCCRRKSQNGEKAIGQNQNKYFVIPTPKMREDKDRKLCTAKYLCARKILSAPFYLLKNIPNCYEVTEFVWRAVRLYTDPF